MLGAILKSQYIFGHIPRKPVEHVVPVLGLNLSTKKLMWIVPVPTKKEKN